MILLRANFWRKHRSPSQKSVIIACTEISWKCLWKLKSSLKKTGSSWRQSWKAKCVTNMAHFALQKNGAEISGMKTKRLKTSKEQLSWFFDRFSPPERRNLDLWSKDSDLTVPPFIWASTSPVTWFVTFINPENCKIHLDFSCFGGGKEENQCKNSNHWATHCSVCSRKSAT